MNGHERLNAALEPFASQSQLEVDQIATTPDVSTATIRRNLDHFEQQQLVMRTRGSAVANGVAYDLPLRHKTAHRAPKKQHSWRPGLVENGRVVGPNGGTKTTEVACAPATRRRPDVTRQ
jgi:DeoR family transcriptional regulator of aga operon